MDMSKCANVQMYNILSSLQHQAFSFHSNDHQPSEQNVFSFAYWSACVVQLFKCTELWNMCKCEKVQKCKCCPNTVQIFTLYCTVCDVRFDYAGIFLILNLHHAIAESHNEFLNQCLIVLAFPFPQEKTGCPCLGCNQNMIPGRFETRFPRLSDQ